MHRHTKKLRLWTNTLSTQNRDIRTAIGFVAIVRTVLVIVANLLTEQTRRCRAAESCSNSRARTHWKRHYTPFDQSRRQLAEASLRVGRNAKGDIIEGVKPWWKLENVAKCYTVYRRKDHTWKAGEGWNGDAMSNKGHHVLGLWLKRSSVWRKIGWHHQLAYRVTPTLVTPLLMSTRHA